MVTEERNLVSKTYTVKQVAQALGFSTNTVYKYLDQGKIKATRLGKEGRFRIPEEEVIRLLGIKGEHPQISSSLQGVPLEASSESESYEEKLSLLTKVSNPDLFDWFLSLSAIFSGIAYLFFPLHFQSPQLEPYINYLLLLKIALIIFGIALMAVDLFIPDRSHHNHPLVRLALFLCFLGLTVVFYLSDSLWTASYFITLAIFSLIPIFIQGATFIKFFIFVYTLIIFSGMVWAKNPQPFFFVDIRDFIEIYPGLFETLLFSGSTIILGVLLYSRSRSKPLLTLTSYLVGGLFFLIAVYFISVQAWNKAVIVLLVASFSLIIPFSEQFDSLSKFTRKEVSMSFAWLVLMIVVGIMAIVYTQTSYKKLIFQESSKRVETAARLVDEYVVNGVKYTNSLTQDNQLVQLLSAAKKDTPALENLVKNMYQGATTLKRIVITDSEGQTLAVYPYVDDSSSKISLGDREYFKQLKLSKKTIISEAVQGRFSNTTTIVIAVPILDNEGDFHGSLLGGLDIASLEERLSAIEFGITGKFTLADQTKTIIIHPDRTLVGESIKVNSNLAAAVDGHSGQAQDYSEEGELSLQAFTPVKLLGWGIIVEQPLSEALRESSLISFIIFLITLLGGVGTLLATIYLKRRKL